MNRCDIKRDTFAIAYGQPVNGVHSQDFELLQDVPANEESTTMSFHEMLINNLKNRTDCDAPKNKEVREFIINKFLGFHERKQMLLIAACYDGWSITGALLRHFNHNYSGNRNGLDYGMDIYNEQLEQPMRYSFDAFNGVRLMLAKQRLQDADFFMKVKTQLDLMKEYQKHGALDASAFGFRETYNLLVERFEKSPLDHWCTRDGGANLTTLSEAFDLVSVESKVTQDLRSTYYEKRDDGSIVVQVASNLEPRVMKLGRFLQQAKFNDKDIRSVINAINGVGFKLVIATDKNEIVNGYQGDYSSSCMRYDRESFDATISEHPSAVYADCPNVAVAFLYNADDRVISRAVVTREEKKFYKYYGHPLLETLLEKDGYERDSDFLSDQLIRRIPNEEGQGGYVMPYLDGCNDNVDYAGEGYFKVVSCGEYSADDSGAIDGNETTWSCDECGDNMTDDDDNYEVISAEDFEEHWCEGCKDASATDVGGNSAYIWTHDDNVVDAISAAGQSTSICMYNTEDYVWCEFNDVWVHEDQWYDYRRENSLNYDGNEEVDYDDEENPWWNDEVNH